MFYVCADPLSTYPTFKQLSELEVDQWFELGLKLGLTEEQLEKLKNCSQPTLEIFVAAKVKNIDLNWKNVVESLVLVGEYKMAKTVCRQRGWFCFLSDFILTF